MYIAVDFDDTLAKSNAFPEIGEPIENIIHLVRYLKARGHTIIIWTCRTDTDERKYLTEALAWLDENNVPYDYANENPEFEKKWHPFVSRKLYADWYIDDKSVSLSGDELLEFLKRIDGWRGVLR